MPRSFAPAAAIGLTALLVGAAVPASAAPASSYAPAAWAADAPDVYEIGGDYTWSGKAATDDRTPRFVADVASAQAGGVFEVRRVSDGTLLCSASVVSGVAGHVAECTSTTVLDLGTTAVDATVVAPGGKERSATTHVGVMIAPQDPTIEIAGYDRATDTVWLRGTSMPGTGELRIGQDVDTEGGYEKVTVKADGTWSADLHHPVDKKAIESGLILGPDDFTASKWYAGTYFDKAAPVAPVVEHTVANGMVVVDAQVTDADMVEVKTLDGKTAAAGPTKGGVAHLTLPAPTVETELFVTAVRKGVSSPSAFFTVNKGIGVRATNAPTVSVEKAATGSATVSVHGLAGAVAVITDESGATKAIKKIGASGTAQLAVRTASSKAATTFYVAQSLDGQRSFRDDFTVPAA